MAEIKASLCWKINCWLFQHLIRYLYVLLSPVSSCFKVLSWEQFRRENCSAALRSLPLCQGVSRRHSKTKRHTLGKVWILDHSGLISWDTVASILCIWCFVVVVAKVPFKIVKSRVLKGIGNPRWVVLVWYCCPGSVSNIQRIWWQNQLSLT